MVRFLVFNESSPVVYYKGATYFGFKKLSSNLDNWKSMMYDNEESAKRALRKLKKEDMKFYKIACSVAKKEDWHIATIMFNTSFNITA